MTLSCVILAKNEAEMIEGCLDSLKILEAFEVLVIDDDSTDTTVKIVKDKGAKVISHTKKDFAQARNFAKTKASGEWVLYIDADERLSEELAQKIRKIISFESPVTAYELTRVNYYLGKRWPKTETLLRLFKRSALKEWQGEVHETAIVEGQIGRLIEPLFHYTHRNLSEMVENTIVWSEIEARLRFNAKHPPVVWWRIPRVTIPTFFDYYLIQGGWKVGTVGLIESIYQAFSIFITYARLWELQQKTS